MINRILIAIVFLVGAAYSDEWFGAADTGVNNSTITGITYRINSANIQYIVPGSGTMRVDSIRVRGRSSSTGSFRLAIYNTALKLICQASDSMQVSDLNDDWRTQYAFVDSTKTPITDVLMTAGDTVVPSVTAGGTNFQMSKNAVAFGWVKYYAATNYTDGFPGTIAAGASVTEEPIIQIYVSTAGGCTKATIGAISNYTDTTGDSSHIYLPITGSYDSVTFAGIDSISRISAQDSALIWPKYTYSAQPCSAFVWSCAGDSVDTAIFTVTTYYRQSRLDSLIDTTGTRVNNKDTVYYDWRYFLKGSFPYDTVNAKIPVNGDTLTVDSLSTTEVGFRIADTLDIGNINFIICDTNGVCDTSDTVYLAGQYTAPQLPEIVLDPQNCGGPQTTICTLFVTYNDSNGVNGATQWLSDSGGGEVLNAVVDETNDSIFITLNEFNDGWWYKAIRTTANGADTSDSAQIHVWPKYLLSYDPGAGIGEPPAALTEYDSSAVVTVLSNTGYINFGYNFTGWNTDPGGAGTAYSPTDQFNITGITTLYAMWEVITYTVEVSVTNGITDKTGTNVVDSGVALVITHAPNLHYHLTAITVTGSSDTTWTSATEFSIAPNEPCNVTIVNSIDTFTLTEVPSLHGTVTYVPDAEGSSPRSYDYGTWVHVTAVPDSGYAFVVWQGGTLSSTTAIDSVQMQDHYVISPVFSQIPVIDSIRQALPGILRDSLYPQAARIGDLMLIYGRGFEDQGDSSKAYQSSTGNTVYEVVSWSDTLLAVSPSPLSVRGFHRSWIRNNSMVSGTPKSRAILIKKFYGDP